MEMQASLLEKFRACMVLHAVGDAMGYKNGSWEFNYSGSDIHQQLESLGGLEKLEINARDWRVSDDTVLHLANAFCLSDHPDLKSPRVYIKLVDYYKDAMKDMKGRAPGGTCINSIDMLKQSLNGYRLPYNPKGAGCGVSMRSSCIGLRFCKPEDLDDLVAFSVESGRMTHHHPIGYLGGLAAALFTSYAIQNKPVISWGAQFLKDLERAKQYIIKEDYCVEQNLADWEKSIEPWKRYLKVRNIENGLTEPVFPAKYGVNERESFYKTVSGFPNSWPGALGIDSVLIAYDALLSCDASWFELCRRAMLHGGDNDSTGSLAGSWYGALFGFKNVPANHYKNLEYLDKLNECGKRLHDIVQSKA